ncbi:type I secretion system permease/ATPase [Aestuariivirga sp.]|uniref:type I secretion system permease/ATPase n=1 Tax=Aestuariivirga sp. TaxID=2650926 RepID=UPI00391DF46A
MPRRPSNQLSTVTAALRRQLPLLVTLSCLLNLLLLVSAIYMLQIYDRVLSTGSLDTLLWLTVIALFAIVIYGMLEQSRRMILSRAAGWIDRELSVPMLRRSMEARLAGEDGHTGMRDVGDLRRFHGEAALAFLDTPWSVIFLAFMWVLHPAMGLVGTIGAIFLLALTIANDLLTRRRQREVEAETRESHEHAVRFVEAGETIGPLGMTGQVFRNWRQRHDAVSAEQQLLQDRTTTILSLSRSIRIGLQVAVLGAGAYYVLAGEMTAGAMIASSIVMGRALSPIERATGAWRAFVAARGAHARLQSLFSRREGNDGGRVVLPRPRGRFACEDVFYIPPGSREPILHGVDFALEAGDNCAVVGPSGSGKSTLCRLAIGAWKPAKGHVRLDGADVSSWDPDELGPHIGYLPQQIEFLPGTVAQNIARFRKIDGDQLVRAAELAGVHQLILELPYGYETEIALHSQKISLGQRQRLALARALYGDPAFVVLDEPNANMDEAGDRALITALTTLKHLSVTVLIVSHRISVLKYADKILALQNGAVAAFAPRDQILRPVQSASPGALPAHGPAKTEPQLAGADNHLSAAE